MNPISSSDPNKYTCSSIISASCVLWNTSTTGCITTCAGDSLVDVVTKTINKVCLLDSELDFTNLNLAACITTPTNKSLSNILTAIADKVCAIQTQVNNLPTVPGGSTTCDPINAFTLPTCYASFGKTGYSIPSDTTLINGYNVQYVADAVCSLYTYMDGRMDELFDQIATCCGSGSGSGTIPTVTSDCLFSGSIAVNLAYEYLDTAFCAQKTILGTNIDLAAALNPTAPCTTSINSYLGTSLGTATTLDESLVNIYDAICKMTAKVSAISTLQSQCCVFTCDSIDIAILGEVVDPIAKTVDLVFTFNGSTSLPASYDPKADTGSKVTFTDKNGSFITVSIDLFDDASYTGIDLTGLDFSGNITMSANLNYQISYGVDGSGDPIPYNCNKCLSGTLIIDSNCAVCSISIFGGTDINVKITYTFEGSTHIITTTTNGLLYIPTGSVITSVIDESTVAPTITTECPGTSIPTPETLTCWRFAIPGHLFRNATGGGLGVPENEASDFNITGIISNGVRYGLGTSVPTHFGVKSTDNPNGCTVCGGGPYLAGQALTSVVGGYNPGSLNYNYSSTMANYVNVLNSYITPSNPYIKMFTSACTNDCKFCMNYRFLHVRTYGSIAPLLEVTNTEGLITTVAQIVGEQITTSVDCRCEGE